LFSELGLRPVYSEQRLRKRVRSRWSLGQVECHIDSGGNVIHETHYSLVPLGFLHSPLKDLGAAPNQGREGAPDAWLEVDATVAEGLEGSEVGDELIVITWLHRAGRDTLKTHPRNDETRLLVGVFATLSPDRPNPPGLHRVTVREIAETSVKVGPIEAIEGTPVVDIKPVLSPLADFKCESLIHQFSRSPALTACKQVWDTRWSRFFPSVTGDMFLADAAAQVKDKGGDRR